MVKFTRPNTSPEKLTSATVSNNVLIPRNCGSKNFIEPIAEFIYVIGNPN
jgi:hypothetical protein